MLPSMLSRFVPDYRSPLGVCSSVPRCTLTCTLRARPCPWQSFLEDGSRPIQLLRPSPQGSRPRSAARSSCPPPLPPWHLIGRRSPMRSEEHTSELQSHHDIVCRLLLEKKKHITIIDLNALHTKRHNLFQEL